jgi:hypothetical protein
VFHCLSPSTLHTVCSVDRLIGWRGAVPLEWRGPSCFLDPWLYIFTSSHMDFGVCDIPHWGTHRMAQKHYAGFKQSYLKYNDTQNVT